MNRVRKLIIMALVIGLAGLSASAQVQRRNLGRDQQARQLIRRIETRTDVFRNSVAAALDQSRINGSRREDNINQLVADFENATNALRDRVNSRQAVAADVQSVLDQAALIDRFMRRTRIAGSAETDWASLRLDLNELARIYGVSGRWDTSTYPRDTSTYPRDTSTYPRNNYPSTGYPQTGAARNQLTGTYRLDATRSDDARAIADRSTRNLSYRERQRILDSLTSRLESPTALAIDRRGRTVMIASSRAPQFTFEADGVERVEQTGDGRSVRVRSAFNGDQLVVASTGDRNSDFSVTFEPLEGGRRLRVVRRISDINLTTPITVESIYDRTSDIAQLDIYNGGSTYPTNGGSSYPTTGTGANSGDFVIPDGTSIEAVLNNDLTTRDTRENDRFTLTVRQPSEYQGATITGYVTNISRSGRVSGRSEITLNFESITMRNGQSYRFAGVTEAVRTANGETVRVDNEGSVRDTNRTNTTAQRAAIGTAVGAIIGAIAGGGKGAAIGAIVGAGAGAGSVYVQGQDDLQLLSGTVLTIRASGPR
ncbi:MAG: hypothetical protein QOJ64_1802 [Acidobacteriota bacterium]|jgi:hypothetical protein|nr:hypothetical protein [Acidobacteriota bacterium]